MKYIITLFIALIMSVANYADVVKNGNVYSVETTTAENQFTGRYYQDKSGKQYPIYRSKKGSFYIIKISKKTGKEYRQYLPKEVQEVLKKEFPTI